jgi:hypothetical protein
MRGKRGCLFNISHDGYLDALVGTWSESDLRTLKLYINALLIQSDAYMLGHNMR